MNGIISINKPAGWTSHDVIAKLRGVLREKRIGHSGTLDPMATGVLPVFVGRATRAIEFCDTAEKEYVAGMRLGMVTDTQDITGRVIESRKVPDDISPEKLEEVLVGFRGVQKQLPPMYSAVKVNGKKLYELARKGIEIERKEREITVFELELLDGAGTDWAIRALCSKGTYMRTLCGDIGESLGCGAAMSSLVRTRAGSFTLKDSRALEEVISAAECGAASDMLLPIDSLFMQYPKFCVDQMQESKCRNGMQFETDLSDGLYRVYSRSGEFLLLGTVENEIMKTVKNFFEVK